MATIAKVDINDISKNVRVNFEINEFGEFTIRSRIGGLFVRFGLWIIGVDGNIEFKD